LGIISTDFDVIDQFLTEYSAFVRYWRKWEYNGTVGQLHKDFEKLCDTQERSIVKNLPKFLIFMNEVRLIKTVQTKLT